MDILLLALIAGTASVPSDKPQRIAVLPIDMSDDAQKELPTAFVEEAILSAIEKSGHFHVIGHNDIATVVDLERQKDLLGCDNVQCIAEIAGALNVGHLVAVRIDRLGDEWAWSAKLLELQTENFIASRDAQMMQGNAKKLIKSIDGLIQKLMNPLSRKYQPKRARPGPTLEAAVKLRGESAYEPFKYYVDRTTWNSYVRHVEHHKKPIPLASYVHERNQESTALAVSEFVTCLGALVAMMAQQFTAGGVAAVGCITLPVIDALDVGSIEQHTPPPTVATLPPAIARAQQ